MAKQAHAMKPQHVPKTHSIDCSHRSGKPHADDQAVDRGDEVQWASSEGRCFTIYFEAGTPFTDNTFVVPQGGTVSSGPATGEKGTYKYSLEDDEGVVTDPTIIVQN